MTIFVHDQPVAIVHVPASNLDEAQTIAHQSISIVQAENMIPNIYIDPTAKASLALEPIAVPVTLRSKE